jgi:HPt (histidine-containing phosphotransfer) domain-containing protein
VTGQAIDPTAFANLLDITGGDRVFVDELVDTFLEEGDRLVGELVAAAADGDTEGLVRPAHSLKSSCLNVGALELGELCRRLEADARGDGVPAAEAVARVATIRRAFDDARGDLLEERTGRA